MSSKYTPPQEKVITSLTLDEDVRDWMDLNLPKNKRSDFINKIARRYIRRQIKLQLGDMTRRVGDRKATAT